MKKNNGKKNPTKNIPVKKKNIQNPPVKKKNKVKSIKKINAINGKIYDILFFDNKNFLINGGNIYKVYNEKLLMVKNRNIDCYIDHIKIIDNNNFICLKNKTELIQISVKNGNQKSIFNFGEKIDKILYYKNKYIAKGEEPKNERYSIKVWETLSNNQIQLVTEIVFPYKELHHFEGILYLVHDKNFFIYSGNRGDENVTYFFNLKAFEIENKIEDFDFDNISRLNDNLLIFTKYSYIYECDAFLDIYNISEKKNVERKYFEYALNYIEVIHKKEIVLISGYNDAEYSDIHLFDYNLKEIQLLKKTNFGGIVGIKLYEKNENEDLVLSFSEDGSINILSFCD